MPPVTKVSDNNELLETSKFPHAKWSFEKFNPVQSRVFEYYDKDNNLIIATATSSVRRLLVKCCFLMKLGNVVVKACT